MALPSPDKLSFIFGRRSVRSYEDKPIDDDTIDALLQAAMAAPSASNKNPWRFVVVRNRAMLTRIAEGLPHGKMLPSAAAGIVVCGEPEAASGTLLSFMIQDCSAAIENILLAAHALGLGTCWLGVHPNQERVDHIARLLKTPSSVIPVSVIAVGHPAEQKEPRTRYDKGHVHIGTW